LTRNELVLPFGGTYVCANFGENRSRNARVLADGQTHRQTQTDLIICPMLYAIAMGQITSEHNEFRDTHVQTSFHYTQRVSDSQSITRFQMSPNAFAKRPCDFCVGQLIGQNITYRGYSAPNLTGLSSTTVK